VPPHRFIMVNHSRARQLVYLHCSSIFRAENAKIRRLKKVTQLLSQHKASIKVLIDEFTLETIASVAKQLLEQKIFESPTRARKHFPELFQTSERQVAARVALEAEVARTEAEAVKETMVTSDEEWEEETQEVQNCEDQGQPTCECHNPVARNVEALRGVRQ
jgi:hypothetical protein